MPPTPGANILRTSSPRSGALRALASTVACAPAHPRSPRAFVCVRRYCVQETCSARRTFNPLSPTLRTSLRSRTKPRACADFDALYAYLTTSNYDFNVKMPNSNTPQSAQ